MCRTKFATVCILILLSIGIQEIKAQNPVFFEINRRKINIESFNTNVKNLMKETGTPGASIAIINHGKVVFTKAYGCKAEKANADVNTVFEACSLSKTFLVYVAHKLADAGKLDFDKPLYEYISNKRLSYDERNKLITARMVLSHSSGIENWQAMNNPDTLEILSTPGKKFIYSGEGYNYLAGVIEVILKEKYEAYIKEMVLYPLKLKHTFTTFTEDGKIPHNYAVGHNPVGEPVEKLKNTEADPASGINTNAADYANLVISIFNGRNLSSGRIKDIERPVIRLNDKDTTSYYGPGFAIIYTGKDTLIYQGGDNEGFKACVVYSIATKTGLVLMTNSDRGLVMVQKLNELSTNFNINRFIEKAEPNKQYPNDVTSLLKKYREGGLKKMTQKLEGLKNSKKMQAHTLDELSYAFLQTNPELSVKLLRENTVIDPRDATTYYLLGVISQGMNDYYASRDYFMKAKELNFPDLDYNNSVELFLRRSEAVIQDIEARKLYISEISDNKIDIQAENYNEMEGIKTGISNDADSSRDIRELDEGDWLNYKVNVAKPGLYVISFRIRNGKEPANFELQSGTKLLTKINIPAAAAGSTGQWQTVTSTAELSQGAQTLKLNIRHGGIRINWFEFSKNNTN